ncbi:UNVERIFIED_ORG: hypothetical protein OKW15_003594 [Pseudomonas reinekei]|nr:hypothetical protein [Pseudomonas reinekei]
MVSVKVSVSIFADFELANRYQRLDTPYFQNHPLRLSVAPPSQTAHRQNSVTTVQSASDQKNDVSSIPYSALRTVAASDMP